MVVEDADLVDRGGAWSDGGLRAGDVFAVLAAARVRAVGREDDGEGLLHSVGRHSASVSASIGCQLRFPQ